MPNIIVTVFVLVMGLILGSFINVVALRDKNRKSILNGRSKCPNCKHQLVWYDLIPILSFVFLKGKCRYCHKSISLRYPLVEILASALTYFAYWYGYVQYGSLLYAITTLIAILLLFIVALTDIQDMEVDPVYISVAGIVAAIGGVASGWMSWQSILLGVLAGAGSIALVSLIWKLLFKKDGMGAGDIWIAGAMGAILGYPQIWVGMMAAVLLGALIGIYLMIRSVEKNLQTAMPFGPFLFIGTIYALIWAEQIIAYYSPY